MEMKKEEDGSLGLYSEDQRVFWFDKPYMYDGKGCVSQEVELLIEAEEGGCKVTVKQKKNGCLPMTEVIRLLSIR